MSAALTIPVIAIVVDVGTVDPRERLAMVFETFATLAPGQALELVSDCDPESVLEQFAEKLPGQFWWQGKQGPLEQWRIVIGKPEGNVSACTSQADFD